MTVVIPSVPQSWISKAHLVGKSLKSLRLHPNPSPEDDGVEWNVVDGTPASCTQLGLYHLTSRSVDLVVSGPNWGRNVTTLYNLASGTVGGALEGAQCGKKALAISFASKDSEPTEVIKAACRVATRLVSHLSNHWAPGVELYAINVPMIPEIDKHRAIYTTSVPCHWTRSSLFQEVAEKDTPQIEGVKEVREFRWRPHLKDVEHGIANAPPGTDGSAMIDGNIR